MTGVLITGASGYLGSSLADFLKDRGARVVRALRAPPAEGRGEHVAFSLGAHVPDADELGALDLSAVVHCAHDHSARSWEDMCRRNVEGTMALARAAAAAGIARQVFISSLSAFPGCVSRYGRSKLLAEEGMQGLDAIVVRPGLLYDENPRGLVGTMKRLAARLPIIPLIGSGAQPQYTCHVQDLCACILRLVEDGSVVGRQGPVMAANPVSLPFKEIVARLAIAAGRRRPVFVPMPWRLVWAGLALAETAGLHTGLRSDSVLGLQFAAKAPDFTSQRRLGMVFRPFQP
jgi:nucleoside-diphosphate-sugar epimerase